MESRQSGQEKHTGTKTSLSVCDSHDSILSDGDSGKMETSCGETAACHDLQTAGKPKKAHFKFFGGKKSICTLPSFFGGKHKGLGKGNFRKGLSKSKTHDGISDVQIEDGKKFFSDSSNIKLHGLELTRVGTCLTSSHSTDLNVTAPAQFDLSFHDTSPHSSTDCFDKKINGDKSLSFPRPKKGLKGLFSSIRRHKKNKVPDVEKSEHFIHAAPCLTEQLNEPELENMQEGNEQTKIECLPTEVSQEPSLSTAVGTEETESSECLSDVAPIPSVELPVEPDHLNSLNKDHSLDAQLDSAVICSSDDGIFSEIVSPDVIDKVPLSSGDQISLIFEDVSSLKSFDSLTGCGDIIADQDIDTVSDNAISLEQTRENAKRSSCLVTYQGGGEEMATPDDMEEEYLQQLLEDANEAEGSYELNNEKEATKVRTAFSQVETAVYPLCAQDSFTDRAILSNTELLTPQSDQQESAPNSDEGYYDSNTPGPEDDSGEGFNHKERLPRDSYSGDALYEFYEPEDSLMSPAPGGESLYETKTPCSEIFDQFFDFSLTSNNDLIQDHVHKTCATETEEERLAVIQKQLLFWERQREATLKGMAHVNKGIFPKEEQNVECKNKADILCHNKDCHLNNHSLLQNISKGGAAKVAQNTLTEKQSWNNFQDTPFRDSYYEGSYIQHLDDNSLMKDPRFELNVTSLGTQDVSDNRKTNTGGFPSSRVIPVYHRQNVFGPDLECHQENECEQAVNFSQTFAEFTNNTTLFSSISDCLVSAGSSSSFHRDLNALPTMVTFDVVDVENEGECEHHVELSPDEVEVSSFETFDHSCVQESLADCEELFHTDLPNPLQTYNWGVTSLPRHFGHYKLNSSMPAPLSSNRRSRSLDTENLETELGALRLSKSGLKSYDFLGPREDGKNSWRYENECFRAHETEWGGCSFLEQSSQTSRQFSQYTPTVSSNHGYGRANEGIIPSKQLPLNRQMAKTTDPPLQCNTRQSQEASTMCGYPAEQTTKKLALVLPLEDRRGVGIHQSSYKSHTSGKPIGVTQAMPQQNKNEDDFIKPPADYQDNLLKRTVEQEVSANKKWANNYTECTGS
eukprot:XP_017952237.1 PREDICTED: APC membrane recruitment protein 1 [Xenopus tropicalis]